MTRFVVAILFILPIAFSAPAEEKEKNGRSLPLTTVPGGVVATGALGANYGQQTQNSETHDKKKFGLDFSSDRGTSNQFSNTGFQAGVAGGVAQTPGYPVYQYQYPQYPIYPGVYSYPQYQYPQYPIYPNYGVGVPNVGVPNLGVGSSVQLPNVSVNSGAAVVPGGVGQAPVRY